MRCSMKLGGKYMLQEYLKDEKVNLMPTKCLVFQGKIRKSAEMSRLGHWQNLRCQVCHVHQV